MVVLLCAMLLAADASAPPAAPDAVRALIAQLGDDEYAVREAAQQKLEALPPDALPLISRAYRDTTDAEVRMRLRLYAEHYFDHHVLPRYSQYHRPGYLGIQQTEGRLDDGSGFVRVVQVMPGTGAEAARLKPGDLIIALNGQPMPAVNATFAVAQYVQQHRPGDKLVCTVLRDGKQLEITAVLGGLPDEHLSEEDRLQRQAEHDRLHQRWWQQGFLAGNPDFDPTGPDDTD